MSLRISARRTNGHFCRRWAENGILAKGGGEVFEKSSKIDCVVFDKTGTLTVGGDPRITDSIVFPDGDLSEVMDERTLLSGLKAAEESSSHPIAKAIVSYCGSEWEPAALGHVEELPGKGMKAAYRDRPLDLAVDNEHLMRGLSVPLSKRTTNLLESWKGEAKSVALVSCKRREDSEWKLAAILTISDPI
ncbi:hypothetical protein HIM_10883 [Hirsutella minnesotensis 3608]|uniref:Uncharacterized protein n=1 Tax=Hirsutella minnesotensis 3608 TaxID=1043627 RepID=A0A0F8A1U3_9HYPO|nr:hypothetical protein HIM_10883 [Hirsutella minnesotensis 3608]